MSTEILDFEALQRLKKDLAAIRRRHLATMEYYVSEPRHGFWHQPEKKHKSSLSSTATCVSSLVHAALWSHKEFSLRTRTAGVANELIGKNQSAQLDPDNPFSLSFVAEGVLNLRMAQPNYEGSDEHFKIVTEQIASKLVQPLMSKDGKLGQVGSISLGPYPPSAYLTQLAFRVLDRCGAAKPDIKAAVHRWSRGEINKQVALITARSRNRDALQLAYALILAVKTVPDEKTTPEDKEIFRHALELFFSEQQDDGSWPLSRPLFHYPEVGNAYCFDYELLTELLSCKELWDDLLDYIGKLARATDLLQSTAFDLLPEKPGTVVGWASGHHPQLSGPESWSTACVYHFAHALDRFVAEAIRRAIFRELGAVYSPPTRPKAGAADEREFAPDFLDARFRYQGHELSLRESLKARFVDPIDKEADKVAAGGKLDRTTPMSAILFGPPGTSKTQLAEIISSYLGWPLVVVDPSYLVKEGMDQIQAMANRLFSMLALAEQVVVLLDEFDEMGRDRARTDDLISRFITTAMLPKLAEINKARKIVFLLATNYVSGFDAAFSRGGRFDMLLQVLQPTQEAKLGAEKWSSKLSSTLDKLDGAERGRAETQLADLTYLETEQLVQNLQETDTREQVVAKFQATWSACTLEKINDAGAATPDQPTWFGGLLGSRRKPPKRGRTWRETTKEDAAQTRLPG